MERPEYVECLSCVVSLEVAGAIYSVCVGMASVACGYVMLAV